MRRFGLILLVGMAAIWANIFIWPVIPSTFLNMLVWPIIPASIYPVSRIRAYPSRHAAFLYTQSHSGGRTELSCGQFAPNDETGVILTFGQSNSANHEEKKTIAGMHVGNFNPADGKCYRAKDPMLGATGNEGSLWPVMGQDLIASGRFKNVLIVPVGVGSSEIESWRPATRVFFPRVERALQMLSAAKLHVTDVIFQQGEFDAGVETPGDVYLSAVKEIISRLRTDGVNAPIIMAIATGCGDKQYPIMKLVRSKISRFAEGVYLGPDFGEVPNRYNECHLFGADAEKESSVLANEIIQIRNTSSSVANQFRN